MSDSFWALPAKRDDRYARKMMHPVKCDLDKFKRSYNKAVQKKEKYYYRLSNGHRFELTMTKAALIKELDNFPTKEQGEAVILIQKVETFLQKHLNFIDELADTPQRAESDVASPATETPSTLINLFPTTPIQTETIPMTGTVGKQTKKATSLL